MMLPSLSQLGVPTAGKKGRGTGKNPLPMLGPDWQVSLAKDAAHVYRIVQSVTLRARHALELAEGELLTVDNLPWFLEQVLKAYYLREYLPTMNDAVLKFHEHWVRQLQTGKNWKKECTNAPAIERLMDTVGASMAAYCYETFWTTLSSDERILELMNSRDTNDSAFVTQMEYLTMSLHATIHGMDYLSNLDPMQKRIKDFGTTMKTYWPRLERLYFDTRARLTQLAPAPPPPRPPPSVYTPAPPAEPLDRRPFEDMQSAAAAREAKEAAARLAAKTNEDTRRKRDQEQRMRATQKLEAQDQRRRREPGSSSSSPSDWETTKAALRAQEVNQELLDAKRKDIAEEHERILVQKAAARTKEAEETARLAERAHALEIADEIQKGN